GGWAAQCPPRLPLLYGYPAGGSRCALGQSKLQHAVLIARLGLLLVYVLRQRECAVHLAVVALAAQRLLGLLLFLLTLDLGADRDLVAIDRNLNFFILHARNLRVHH